MLRIDATTGLVCGARQCPSPHWDARPDGVAVDLVVVHGISLPPGEYGGPWIDRLFLGTLPAHAHPYFEAIAGLRVSAHLLVRRDGELVQYVPLHRRAWHAGQSCHAGRERCNDYAIGIELEGSDDEPYTDAQYRVLASLVRGLQAVYPGIDAGRVVGHADVAPGRKTDPGPAFDWSRLRALLGSA